MSQTTPTLTEAKRAWLMGIMKEKSFCKKNSPPLHPHPHTPLAGSCQQGRSRPQVGTCGCHPLMGQQQHSHRPHPGRSLAYISTFDLHHRLALSLCSVMDRDSNTHVNITHVWQDNESVKTKTLLTLNGSIHSKDLSRLTPTSDESTKVRVIFRYDYSHAPDGRYDAIRP